MQAQFSPVCAVLVNVAIIETASLFCSEAVRFSLPTAFIIAHNEHLFLGGGRSWWLPVFVNGMAAWAGKQCALVNGPG